MKRIERGVLTTGQAAKICHVSYQTVNRLIDRGILKGFRVPGSKHRRVKRSDLLEFIKKYSIGADGSFFPEEQKENNFDLQKVKEISSLMKELGLAEVEVEHGSKRIFLKREVPILGTAVSPIAKPPTEIKGSSERLEVIKSPTPGTFYGRVEPDSDPYVEIGSEVEPQTTVCIIEAMKVINEIRAEITGTIKEILVEDGQAVEYGTPLFKVRPKQIPA